MLRSGMSETRGASKGCGFVDDLRYDRHINGVVDHRGAVSAPDRPQYREQHPAIRGNQRVDPQRQRAV